MYHVYIDGIEAAGETVTPHYMDARRAFKKLVREFPGYVVDFYVIEGLGENDSVQDILDGVYEGKRVRVMQSCPY